VPEFMPNVFTILVALVVFSTSAFSMTSPPEKNEDTDRQQKSILNVLKKRKDKDKKQEQPTEEVEEVVIELTPEEIAEVEENREKAEKFLRRNFSKAEEFLEKIPTSQRTEAEVGYLEKLKMFDKVLEEEKVWEAQFGKQETTDPFTATQVSRLYKAAQVAILDDEYPLANDYLSQATYLDPKDQKIKSLGELALGEKPKRENVEAKYHELSIKDIYRGNFKAAASNLEILIKFDPDNPVIYERLGTAYYLDWNIDKAVQSWKSALYYDSENKDLLERWIDNAEKYKEEQYKEIKDLIARKRTEMEDMVDEDEFIVTVLFTSSEQSKATSYAQEAEGYLKTDERIEVRENFDTGDFQVVKLVPRPKE